jgi:hypothetical protein
MHMMFLDSFCKMFCDSANQKVKDAFLRDYTAMAWHKAGECNNKGMRFRRAHEQLLIFHQTQFENLLQLLEMV